MTDYGDASVNAPMQAVETVADPAVPTRSAVIDVRLMLAAIRKGPDQHRPPAPSPETHSGYAPIPAE